MSIGAAQASEHFRPLNAELRTRLCQERRKPWKTGAFRLIYLILSSPDTEGSGNMMERVETAFSTSCRSVRPPPEKNLFSPLTSTLFRVKLQHSKSANSPDLLHGPAPSPGWARSRPRTLQPERTDPLCSSN